MCAVGRGPRATASVARAFPLPRTSQPRSRAGAPWLRSTQRRPLAPHRLPRRPRRPTRQPADRIAVPRRAAARDPTPDPAPHGPGLGRPGALARPAPSTARARTRHNAAPCATRRAPVEVLLRLRQRGAGQRPAARSPEVHAGTPCSSARRANEPSATPRHFWSTSRRRAEERPRSPTRASRRGTRSGASTSCGRHRRARARARARRRPHLVRRARRRPATVQRSPDG
jgi:hypothetical protein